VKPVNLLPERHRPRTATGDRQGSSYILLAVLGGVLVAALIYVLTVNQINGRRDAVTQAKADTGQATERIRSLSAYGNFVQVKNARVQGVKQLAEGRFDWEMMMRELGRVLPADVWLISADATSGAGDDASGSPASGSSGSPASPSSGSSSTPSTTTSTSGGGSTATLNLTGCAQSQQEVAVTLVRLRQMNGASDVSLKQSSATKSDSGSSGGDSASGGSGGCAPGEFQFQANVTLAKQDSGSGSSKVPASLGGGS
jgi:Tfp pilus assembly protein PilN